MIQQMQVLLQSQLKQLQKMADHLAYSKNRVELPMQLDDDESLERYEALSSRFARLQDALIPAFRTLARLELEDKKSERMLDLLHLMEKYHIVASVEQWQEMRQLRNIIAHEYWEENDALQQFLVRIWTDSSVLLDTVERLTLYCIEQQHLGSG